MKIFDETGLYDIIMAYTKDGIFYDDWHYDFFEGCFLYMKDDAYRVVSVTDCAKLASLWMSYKLSSWGYKDADLIAEERANDAQEGLMRVALCTKID